jgi:hypothetical protein
MLIITTPVFTNGVTFDFNSRAITVPAGVTEYDVYLPGLDDVLQRTMIHGNYRNRNSSRTILDDEGSIVVMVTDASVVEGIDLVHSNMLQIASAEAFPFSITDNTTDAATDYTL